MLKTVCVIIGIMLLLAIPAIWPYSYFQLLRVVVFVSGIYLAYELNKKGVQNWTWIMAITAIVFNPFLPVYLSKGTWSVMDFIGAIFYFMVPKYFVHKHNS